MTNTKAIDSAERDGKRDWHYFWVWDGSYTTGYDPQDTCLYFRLLPDRNSCSLRGQLNYAVGNMPFIDRNTVQDVTAQVESKQLDPFNLIRINVNREPNHAGLLNCCIAPNTVNYQGMCVPLIYLLPRQSVPVVEITGTFGFPLHTVDGPGIERQVLIGTFKSSVKRVVRFHRQRHVVLPWISTALDQSLPVASLWSIIADYMCYTYYTSRRKVIAIDFNASRYHCGALNTPCKPGYKNVGGKQVASSL